MLPYLREHFGNPASRWHFPGRKAAEAVEAARSTLAFGLKCQPCDVIWTSGATEANNLAVKGAAWAHEIEGKRHIITHATEHPSVLDPCKVLQKSGFDIEILPVDQNGLISPSAVRESIRRETAIVSIMWANNETGVLQPICEIAHLCRDRGVIFHTDATQVVGKVSIDIEAIPVDLLILSAHKFHGPKGVGALVFRRSKQFRRLVALLDGGGHESGARSGTLNVPGTVGCGNAMTQDSRIPAGRKFTPLMPGRVRLRIDWGTGIRVSGGGARNCKRFRCSGTR